MNLWIASSGTKVKGVVDEDIAVGPTTSVTSAKQLNPYQASWVQQFWALLIRSYQSIRKEPAVTYIRLFQNVFLGVVIGILFLDQKYDQVSILQFFYFVHTCNTFVIVGRRKHKRRIVQSGYQSSYWTIHCSFDGNAFDMSIRPKVPSLSLAFHQ